MQDRTRRSSDADITLPMVPLRDIVVFPNTMVPFVVGRRASLLAVECALAGDKQVFLSTQRNAKVDNPGAEEINSVGTIATIAQHLRLPNGNVKLLVHGNTRARVLEIEEDPEGFLRVVLKELDRPVEVTPELQEHVARVGQLFERYMKYSPGLPYETMLSTVKIQDPGRLADFVKNRYASWDKGLGASIEAGKENFLSLEKLMLEKGEAAANQSGRQEFLENLINEFI